MSRKVCHGNDDFDDGGNGEDHDDDDADGVNWTTYTLEISKLNNRK